MKNENGAIIYLKYPREREKPPMVITKEQFITGIGLPTIDAYAAEESEDIIDRIINSIPEGKEIFFC